MVQIVAYGCLPDSQKLEKILFTPQSISCWVDRGDSCLCLLSSGVRILFAAPVAECQQRLRQVTHRRDGLPEIDLCDISGKTGQRTEAGGHLVGTWRVLTKVFNVYAAPEDMPEEMTYEKMRQAVASLTDWHGAHGTDVADAQDLVNRIVNDAYDGGWVIPPLDILFEREESMYKMRDALAMRATFYWSSTPSKNYSENIRGASFTHNHSGHDKKDKDSFACRPVRFVPV